MIQYCPFFAILNFFANALDEKEKVLYNRKEIKQKEVAFLTIENKKLKTAVAVLLLLPLLLIGFLSYKLVTGTVEFKDIHEITVKTPDGKEVSFTEKQDLQFYSDLLENAEFLAEPVRPLEGNTPAVVSVDGTEYSFYLTQSPSSCMVGSADGRLRLLAGTDAVKLLVRDEMQYLYADDILPTLSVRTGVYLNEVLPESYSWQYKKPDDKYYTDETTEKASAPQTFNLYSDFEKELVFSVEPSHYSLEITRKNDDGETVPVGVNSLANLSFPQDTMLSVVITAKWSQASGNLSYGEATYRFSLLYDVPAVVELVGAENGYLRVCTGDLMILKAGYTNENEMLSVSTDCKAGNLVFRYDETAHSSYALIPIAPDAVEGEYSLTVKAGRGEVTYTLDVRDEKPDGIRTVELSDEEYSEYASPEAMAELEEKLAALREKSEGRSLMTANSFGNFVFGAPCAGEPELRYGATVMIHADAMPGDSGMRTMPGAVYGKNGDGEVRAVQSGVVLFAGELGAAGNAVVVSHGMGVCSYYFHLSEISVNVGDQLESGATIGIVGQTGLTLGKDCAQVMLSAGDIYFR